MSLYRLWLRSAAWVAWGAAVVILMIWAVKALSDDHDWKLSDVASLGPLATALAAIVALVVGGLTIRQKSINDRRDQWWKRVQWAIDKASTPNDVRSEALGFAVLTALVEEEPASATDARMLEESVLILNTLLAKAGGGNATRLGGAQSSGGGP